MKRFFLVLALAALVPASAFAWGERGHMMISRLAVETLPDSVPAWLRSPSAADEISYLGPEEDRLRGSGTSYDADWAPGHFLDVGDDGTVAGVVHLDALPKSMGAYADALAKAGTTPYRVGFIPYTILDGFERVRMDLAYWRVYDYLATHAQTPEKRAQFAYDRDLRQTLTVRDIGDWSHFVGDGSQPLHISIHYNGWGDYPNPNNYTTKHIHSYFESQFVNQYAKIDDVRALVSADTMAPPDHLLSQEELAAIVGEYLAGTAKAVPELYQLYGSGDFERGTPKAVRFTDEQLARGAVMLRDLIVLAWENSLEQSVGYPGVPVKDVLAGKVVPSSD
ncbi:MAG TPA: hypothetical protein VMD47_05130 [Candidatus Acidoferrales bacterium]|nr:hypothetical protein [Candidatus Acidoferrales bacterium]